MNIITYSDAEKFVLKFLKGRVKTKISKKKIRNLEKDESNIWICHYADEGYPLFLKFINYLLIFLTLFLTCSGFFSCFIWVFILGNEPDLNRSAEMRYFFGTFIMGLIFSIIWRIFFEGYYKDKFVSEYHIVKFTSEGEIVSYNVNTLSHLGENITPPEENLDEDEIPPAE